MKKRTLPDFYLPREESLWEKYAIIPFFLAAAALCGGFLYLAEKESAKEVPPPEAQSPVKHHQHIDRADR